MCAGLRSCRVCITQGETQHGRWRWKSATCAHLLPPLQGELPPRHRPIIILVPLCVCPLRRIEALQVVLPLRCRSLGDPRQLPTQEIGRSERNQHCYPHQGCILTPVLLVVPIRRLWGLHEESITTMQDRFRRRPFSPVLISTLQSLQELLPSHPLCAGLRCYTRDVRCLCSSQLG